MTLPTDTSTAELARGIRVAEMSGKRRILLIAPPGSGAVAAARRLAEHPVEPQHTMGVCWIDQILPLPTRSVQRRPFRAPHHTMSAAGMLGTPHHPRPGELAVAYGGLLLLDEVGLVAQATMTMIGDALQRGHTKSGRPPFEATYGADCLIIGITSPCPCGRGSDTCRCAAGASDRFTERARGCFDWDLVIDCSAA